MLKTRPRKVIFFIEIEFFKYIYLVVIDQEVGEAYKSSKKSLKYFIKFIKINLIQKKRLRRCSIRLNNQ